jgi:hypothetical protein
MGGLRSAIITESNGQIYVSRGFCGCSSFIFRHHHFLTQVNKMRKRNEWGKLYVFQKANCQKQLTVLWLNILRDSGEFVAN